MGRNLFNYLRENFYDKKFSLNKSKYINQCLITTLICFLVLTTLSIISSAVVIASIASTAFLIFSVPHGERSKTRYVIGGYLVGFLVGFCFYYITQLTIPWFPNYALFLDELFGAVAIGFSIFIMVVVDVDHPPASAAALAMVITEWNWLTIAVTFFALIIMLVARHLLRPKLIDLIKVS